MAQVQAIFPIVVTSDSNDAGTHGEVYMGIGGREFRLESPRDDFRRGYPINLAVGEISQVSNPTMNDPRDPYKMLTEHLDLFPVYLRLEGTDHWKVAMAFLIVLSGPNGSSMQATDYFDSDLPPYGDGKGGLWLGPKAGKYLYMRRTLRSDVKKLLKIPKVLEAAKGLPPGLLTRGTRPKRR